MFNYYLGLALRSLRRNIVLTALMIAAVGVGIGASMTTLTVFRAMDNDPIPQKSRQLFAVQIDNWGPDSKSIVPGDVEHFQEQISYTDAIGLMNAKAAPSAGRDVQNRCRPDARESGRAALSSADPRNLCGFLSHVPDAFSWRAAPGARMTTRITPTSP